MPGNPEKPRDESESADAHDARIRAVIGASSPEDYDGHTGFDRMTPRARLEWLDAAVQFIETNRQRLTHVAEDPPPRDWRPPTTDH